MPDRHTDTQTHTQLIWAEPSLERFGDKLHELECDCLRHRYDSCTRSCCQGSNLGPYCRNADVFIRNNDTWKAKKDYAHEAKDKSSQRSDSNKLICMSMYLVFSFFGI